MLTTKEVGKRLGVSADTVLAHIRAGRLLANNISTSTRPSWRISEENLAQFIQATSSKVVTKSAPRRRSRVNCPDYFKDE